MASKKTNAPTLTLLILLFTIEISFTKSLLLNVFLVAFSTILLLYKKQYIPLVLLLLLPFLPALGAYWSMRLNGTGTTQGWLLFSRTYGFAALGVSFSCGVDLEELLLFLEQHHLAPNFVYGLLVVVHALPEIRQEVSNLKEASLFRGRSLSFLSPLLYMKTLVSAELWRDAYTEAMFAHGYDEHIGARSFHVLLIPSKIGIAAAIAFFLLGTSLLFVNTASIITVLMDNWML